MKVSHFYTASLLFIFGIFIATFFTFTWPTLVWLMGLTVVAAIIWRRSGVAAWLWAGVGLAFFVLGGVRMELANSVIGQSLLEKQVGQTITLEGKVVREVEPRESTIHIYLKVKEDILLVTADRYAKINYGDVVEVKGKLKKPEPFNTDLGRVFDYPGYLLARGVEYQISFAEVVVLAQGKGNFVTATLLSFKKSFTDKIEELLTEPAVGLGEGLLLGIKQALGDELENAFRKTGIIHIVVLSGYNVMLVVAFVMFVLGYFLRPRPRVIAGVIAICLFAILVGFSATVVRASMMAGLLLVAHAFGRMYLVLRALMLAGVVMLVINPYLLVYDIGFQLSFLATLGLILISPLIDSKLTFVPAKFGIRTFLVATISTQIAVLPLLLYHIGEFSLVAVIVNVLVLPAVPVAMLFTFATGIAAFVSTTVAAVLAFPTYFILQYINSLALWFGSFTFSALSVPAFPFYLVPICYAILGYILYRYGSYEGGEKYGDLAESLIHSTLKSDKEKSNLDDWEIVEEFDEEIKEKKPIGNVSSDKDETPIFFR